MNKRFGFALTSTGILVLLLSFSIAVPLMQELFYGLEDLVIRVALIIVGLFGVGIGWRMTTLGMRRLQPGAEEMLATDSRAPIIFLRSFADDNLKVPLGMKRPYLLLALPNPTAEAGLARIFSERGPVIAIGRPGEVLPRLGAARVYVSDDQWKEQIAGWMARSGLVVMLLSTISPGASWELDHAIHNLEPERLVLHIPKGTAGDEAREIAYAAFRDTMGPKFPRGLPQSIRYATYIRFSGDWTPEAVENVSTLLRDVEHPRKRSLREQFGPTAFAVWISILCGLALEVALALWSALRR